MSKVKINGKIYLLLLLVICLSGFVINITYAKFTEGYTTNESIADLNYNFNITTNIEEYEMVTISSDDFKVINVDITNNNAETNYYGVWYNLLEPSTENNITIAKVETSANDTSGSIDTGTTKTVTVIIKNNTDTDIKLKVGVGSSTTSTSDITYTGNNKLITETSPQPILLSTVTAGSYVKYVGDNGCSGASCMGQNANYVSDDAMGYCHGDGTATYSSNGFRIAYIDDNNAYLINGGSTDCICTNSDGSMSNSSCSSSVTAANISLHQNNLNNSALKYCNTKFVENNICSNTTSWSMNTNDFANITGNALTSSSCYRIENSTECGYANDLIDNGNYYWLTNALDTDNSQTFSWNEYLRNTNSLTSDILVGMRPVIKLKANTYAMSGTGTYADPYVIEDDDIVTLISGTTITKKAGSTNATTNSTINHNKTKEYLYLDGIDDYINLGLENQDLSSGVTLIARVKVHSLSGNYSEYDILVDYEDGGVGLHISPELNVKMSKYDTEYRTLIADQIELNKWYTLIATYDNTDSKIYINGELSGTLTNVGTIKTSTQPFIIGANPNANYSYDSYSNIDISDAFIYDKALTAEEISTYFSNKITDYPTTNLLSYFHFDAESIG